MNKLLIAAAVMLCAAGACSKGGPAKMATDTDSLAYIIGMNVGMNLRQMDSTLNVEAVCEAIRDVYRGAPRLTVDEARTYYLRYVTYEKTEKMREYEEQFLADIRETNRSYARSNTGLTYAVEEVGDVQKLPASIRDSVVVRYVLRTVDGKELYSSYTKRDTLRSKLGDLVPGLQEGLRLIGKGGKMQVWVPASLAYGPQGDEQLGVQPNATLFYEIDLLDVLK